MAKVTTPQYNFKALKELRDVLHWSIRDVVEKAKLFGLSVTDDTIENWERGKTSPDADKLGMLAATFGVAIERFYLKD